VKRFYFYQKLGFRAIILALGMLASQSRALKTRITAWFPKKIEPKNGLLDWRPGPGTIDQKLENMPPV